MGAIKTYEIEIDHDDLDFGFDLTKDLGTTENIVSVTVALSDPAVLEYHDVATDGKIMAAFVRAKPGATVGQKCLVSLRYVTDNVPPRKEELSFWAVLVNKK